MKNNWISVFDELPNKEELDVEVLGYIQYFDNCANLIKEIKTVTYRGKTKSFMNWQYNEKGSFITLLYNQPKFPILTHWMPLPEPPTK